MSRGMLIGLAGSVARVGKPRVSNRLPWFLLFAFESIAFFIYVYIIIIQYISLLFGVFESTGSG